MEKTIFIPSSSRYLTAPNWLLRISYNDKLEENFEEIFYTHALDIFPDFYCLNFKLKVNTKLGTTIPDFALIAKDYKSWVIGEVELVTHNLTEHILPQMDRFHLGKYDDEAISKKLCQKYPQLDSKKVNELLKSKTPEIFLVANEYKEEWRIPLLKKDVKYISLEVYMTGHKQRVIHVCGDSTNARLIKLAEGEPGPLITGMNSIRLDGKIKDIKDENIDIVVNGALEEWIYIEHNGFSLIMATKSFKHLKNSYILYKNPITGTITLQ